MVRALEGCVESLHLAWASDSMAGEVSIPAFAGELVGRDLESLLLEDAEGNEDLC